MPDTDPPDEINDRECPSNWLVRSPNSDTFQDEPDCRKEQQLSDTECYCDADEPVKGRLPFQSQVADLVANSSEGMVTLDHRRDKLSVHFTQFPRVQG